MNKINLIRSKFTKNNFTTPLQILKFRIPQNTNKFILPPPSVQDITMNFLKAFLKTTGRNYKKGNTHTYARIDRQK